jgi:phospholipase/lecithinase/hemolysin
MIHLRRRNFFAAVFCGALCFFATRGFAQTAPQFSQVVIFGDSLSDDGNIRHRVESEYGIPYPGGDFNYSDGRFTNSSDTDPASDKFAGTWHEQLAQTFLGLPVATDSLDGGFDYAFGGATTAQGTTERTVINNPFPFGGGEYTVTIDNIGKQVDDYLAANTPDPAALYIVWGGGNDLFDDQSDTTIATTAANVKGFVEQLAQAGARYILVPNVPPLGLTPHYNTDDSQNLALSAAAKSYRDELNTNLDAAIVSLTSQGITITLYRLDVYDLFYRLAADAGNYGFTNTTDSAQGQSNVDPDTYLFWDDIHPTTAGHYQIAAAADAILKGTEPTPAQALNLSSRLDVGTGENVLIGGLIVTGTAPKKVLVRGLGPSLAVKGTPLANTLADPTLALYKSGALIQNNDNWKDTQEAAIEATGIAPTNDLESALIATLSPGSYTVILKGKNNGTGIGLVEAYDLDTSATSILANTSTRGLVQPGNDVLIAGFIVGNGGNDTVVVRAIGPSLASDGIGNPLANPALDLYDGNGTLIVSDDNWRDSQEALIQSTGLAPTNDYESAIMRALAPGNYTAVVHGIDGGSGVALVEVYNL